MLTFPHDTTAQKLELASMRLRSQQFSMVALICRTEAFALAMPINRRGLVRAVIQARDLNVATSLFFLDHNTR